MSFPVERYAALKAEGRLPSPKGVVAQILSLCDQPDTNIDAITRAVNGDPALVGRLLRLINSPVYHRPRPAVALDRQAVLALGVRTLRGVALALGAVDANRHGPARRFNYEGYWSHALLRSLLAQHLAAETVRVAPPTETFTLGLLCDIGQLGLAAVFPERYDEAAAEGAITPERAQALFETRAPELTRLLLADWGLPALFVDAAEYMDAPERAAFPSGSRTERLMWLLALCDRWCSALLSTGPEREQGLAAAREAAAMLQLRDLDWSGMSERILDDWRRWSGLMALTAVAAAAPTREQWQPAPVVSAPGREPAVSELAAPLHVLLVDDDAALRALLKNWLSRNSFRASLAENGHQALELAEADPPHIAIVDWNLPGIDGMGTARALRARFADRPLYLIMLTAHGDAGRENDAFEAGFDDYLEKPVSPAMLGARFKAAVRSVRALQALHHERASLQDQLQRFQRAWEHSLRDPDTGLHGATFARDFLGYAHAIAQRHARPLSAVVLTLSADERHGSNREEFRDCAKLLTRFVRTQDAACRVGDNRFLLILADTPLAGAERLVERLQAAVHKLLALSGWQMEIAAHEVPPAVELNIFCKTLFEAQ